MKWTALPSLKGTRMAAWRMLNILGEWREANRVGLRGMMMLLAHVIETEGKRLRGQDTPIDPGHGRHPPRQHARPQCADWYRQGLSKRYEQLRTGLACLDKS